MTVNDIVDKALSYFNGKSVEQKAFNRFFKDINLKVNEELIIQIYNYYNRRLIDQAQRKSKTEAPEDYDSYASRRKEVNRFIDSFATKLTMTEIVTLKQKIDILIDAALLLGKK